MASGLFFFKTADSSSFSGAAAEVAVAAVVVVVVAAAAVAAALSLEDSKRPAKICFSKLPLRSAKLRPVVGPRFCRTFCRSVQ